jgi:aconitase B
MNERIRALSDNASHYANGVCDANANADWYETRDQKFAELLVRECAEQIKTHGISASSEDYGDYEIGFNAGLFHALRTTKEHFGVEE